jgi:hypothetical protein
MVITHETVSRASKGYIENYYNAAYRTISPSNDFSFGYKPEFDRKTALEIIRKDPTVLGALNTLVDRAMKNGYQLVGVDGKSRDAEATKILIEKLRLNKVLRQSFFNLFAYGNVFIENVKDGTGKVKELHVLETTHTEPLVTVHGEVLGYIQVVLPQDRAKTSPDWEPDEVTHIAITKLTSNVWGEIDLEAVYSTVLLKQYIMQYLGWLYGTNQFKGFYNIKNANDVQIKSFLSFLKGAEVDVSKPVIAEGDVTYQLLRDFKDGDTIINLLNKCDSLILALMQVPPIEAGIAGDSNRSNSDAQEQSLLTRIKAIQDVVEDEYAYDLFPKISFEKVRIKFNPLIKSDVGKLLEQAERMVNMGMKPEIIEEYLKNEGFPVKRTLFLSDEEKIAQAQKMMEATAPPQSKSEDMYPSRQRKSDGEPNKRIGTGQNSTTRADQLKRSFDEKFNSYPYIYDTVAVR